MAKTKREKNLTAFVLGEVELKKADVVLNAAQFNAHNKVALMTLEIHECMEAGKIDLVYEDNQFSVEYGGNGPELFEVDNDSETLTVLCLPHDVEYVDWRAIYDKLMK